MSNEKYTFEGQRENEDVKFIIRQHPIVLLKGGLIVLGLLIIGFLPWIFKGTTGGTIFFLLAFLFAAGTVAFYFWYLWWNTLYILTNERLLGTNQVALFTRRVDEVPLSNITNITHETKGILASIFHFGTLKVQTAAGEEAMIIRNVPHPFQQQTKILDIARGKE